MFYQSPQYLKGIRKIQAMGPEDRAITQSLIDSYAASYAGQDMANQIRDMKAASLSKERERDLSLAQGRLDLSRDIFDFEKKQNKTAETMGYLNLAASGLAGYSDYRNKKNLIKKLTALADLYK